MGDLPPARPPLSRTASFDPPQRPSPIPHHQTHLSVSGARTNERPIPLDHSACVSLFVSSLKSAREKTRELLAKNGSSTTEQSVQKAGVTLDLSHHRIANIPVEVIELIKDEIERSVMLGFLQSGAIGSELALAYSEEQVTLLQALSNGITNFGHIIDSPSPIINCQRFRTNSPVFLGCVT